MNVIVIILECTDDTHCSGELSCNKGLCGGNLMFRQPKSTFVRKLIQDIRWCSCIFNIISITACTPLSDLPDSTYQYCDRCSDLHKPECGGCCGWRGRILLTYIAIHFYLHMF